MSIEVLNTCQLFMALLVFFGVFMEGHEHLAAWQEKGWRPIIPKLGFGLLVLGLAGEVIFQTQIDKIDAETHKRAAILEEELAWRSIPENIGKQIISALSSSHHKIVIAYPLGDQEALILVNQFIDIFQKARWEFIAEDCPFWGGVVSDIRIPDSKNETAKLLRQALAPLKELKNPAMPITTEDIPPSSMPCIRSLKDIGAAGDAIIFIGSKRPPSF